MRGLMSVRPSILLVFLLLAGGSPCWGEDEEQKTLTELASEVKLIFRARCLECHGGSETKGGVEILNHGMLVDDLGYVVPEEPDDSLVYELLKEEDESRMPPSNLPSLSEFEIETVRRWIAKGAPAFPEDVDLPSSASPDPALAKTAGVDYALQKILEYIAKQPLRDRRFLRFFSSHHLLAAQRDAAGGATADELKRNQQALAKAINHLSMQPEIVIPESIDPETNTLFAVDIRRLGWDRQPFEIVSGEQKGQSSPLNLFDMVLLEYPYATAYESSATYDLLVEEYFDVANMVRPIPFVRIDWFISVATQSPLYEDILQLPRTLDELEAQLGVDAKTNVADGFARRSGMTVSGVSRNNRVVERHPSRDGGYWKSFDFASSKGQENIFVDPIDFQESGGEMIFNLPNGLQGYMVTDSVGNRIVEAPTSIVTDKLAGDKVVRNALSCIRCHDRGMKSFIDNVRPAVEAMPDSPGFDKRHVLNLYAPMPEMLELLKEDTERFQTALTTALGKPQDKDPLTPVSHRFIDLPLQLTGAAAELGLSDAESLRAVFTTPQFSSFGLSSLASGGAVRRDMWEDYFDRIVRNLGLGTPLVAIDGLTKPDYLADANSPDLILKTNKPGNVFAPGDELRITVKNTTKHTLHIELIGTGVHGEKVILIPAGTTLAAGKSIHFPQKGNIKIQPKLGRETITLFASPTKFPAGRILRGQNVADRFVHDFYVIRPSTDGAKIERNPQEMIKKTIAIETR